MYNVNRIKIAEILANMTKLLNNMKALIEEKEEEVLMNQIKVLAAERVLHISIESIVDVGNLIIDGFIMRDPGSYIDIIEILRDEKVVSDEQAAKLKRIVSYRKNLVQEYYTTNSKMVLRLLKEEYQTLINYEKSINEYLNKELGTN